jgi:hypothetical protein
METIMLYVFLKASIAVLTYDFSEIIIIKADKHKVIYYER